MWTLLAVLDVWFFCEFRPSSIDWKINILFDDVVIRGYMILILDMHVRWCPMVGPIWVWNGSVQTVIFSMCFGNSLHLLKFRERNLFVPCCGVSSEIILFKKNTRKRKGCTLCLNSWKCGTRLKYSYSILLSDWICLVLVLNKYQFSSGC